MAIIPELPLGQPSLYVTLNEIRWAAGQLDGDGSVGVYNGRLRVCMTKAQKGWSALTKFIQLFGGTTNKCYQPDDVHQLRREWFLREEEALFFCQKMAPFTTIKRREYLLAGTMVIGRTPFILTTATQRIVAKNMHAVEPIVGIKRCQLWRYFKRVEGMCGMQKGNEIGQCARDQRVGVIHVKGWTIQRLLKADILAARAKMETDLKALKQTPHEDLREEVSPAYVAGFIDAEGCVQLEQGRPILSTSQKWQPVLTQMQRQWGGGISINKTTGVHSLCFNKHSRIVLEAILQHMVEKENQARLALTTPKSEWVDGKRKLMRMHGGRRQCRQEAAERAAAIITTAVAEMQEAARKKMKV